MHGGSEACFFVRFGIHEPVQCGDAAIRAAVLDVCAGTHLTQTFAIPMSSILSQIFHQIAPYTNQPDVATNLPFSKVSSTNLQSVMKAAAPTPKCKR